MQGVGSRDRSRDLLQQLGEKGGGGGGGCRSGGEGQETKYSASIQGATRPRMIGRRERCKHGQGGSSIARMVMQKSTVQCTVCGYCGVSECPPLGLSFVAG